MHIVLVGLNHRSAPVELRERLAFRREELPVAFTLLRDEVGLREAAILSTCNRVEIYAGAPALDGTLERLHRFLSRHADLELAGLSPRLYSFVEPQRVVRHLFSVASGLDSMVLGEAEILHQVKDAYELARSAGATGKLLNGLFQRALNTGKTVRSVTGIGRGCTSIGTVAVQLAEKIFGELSRAVVLLVGAGKIGELTLKRLAERGAGELRVMSRTLERAAEVAAGCRATAVPVAALAAQLLEADIVITSTSAPLFLLHREELAAAMRARRHRPLCIVDLGVPRNVEPSVGTLENAYLFNVDDLETLVLHQHQERRRALSESEDIINQKVDHFLAWWQQEVLHASPDHRDPGELAGHVPGADRPDAA
jgi:glutamyl-tRNA reductase